MHTLLHSMPPTLQQATANPHLSRDSWTLTGKSGSVSCSVTACFFWVLVHTRFVPSKSLFPQSCVSSGGSVVGLMVTSFKGAMPYFLQGGYARSTVPRAPAPSAAHCWTVTPQETLKHSSVSVSVGSLGPGVNKVCLSLLSISSMYGQWF